MTHRFGKYRIKNMMEQKKFPLYLFAFIFLHPFVLALWLGRITFASPLFLSLLVFEVLLFLLVLGWWRRHYQLSLGVSEDQSNRIFNTLSEAILVFGPDQTITGSNYAAAGLLDYGHQALKGMKMEALAFNPEEEWLGLWWNNYQFSSANPTFEACLKTKRGEKASVLCSVEMLITPEAQFAGMVFVARDISKQKKQEDRLRFLSKAVEQSPVSIAITDMEGVVTYVNQIFFNKSKFAEAEVMGQHFSNLNVSLSEEKVFEPMQAMIDAGETWQAELESITPEGAYCWEQATVTALRAKDGSIEHYIILLEDIDARKKAERQLQRAKEELEERVELRVIELKKTAYALEKANKELQGLDNMKDDFVATVSHELRTPLASILGFAEALLDCEMDRKEQEKFYNIIISESLRLTDLINEILDLSILSAGKHQFDKEYLLFDELVEQAIQAVEGLRKKKKIEIAYFGMPIYLVVDRSQLIQVIVNLLSNAVKFSPEKSRVNINAEVVDNQMNFSVQDQGSGLPAEHLLAVFSRFTQFQKKGQAIQGTGLGLAISKKIIEGHQGKIWAESRSEGGYFAFQIPVGIE